MSNTPLVTVICLCFNHEDYVEDALISLKQQTYTNIEIIIVDDASKDRSVERIQATLQKYDIKAIYLPLSKNIGNCKAFNLAFTQSKGEFIIDFATDDVLLPDRIKDDVNCFLAHSKEYGCVFSDVRTIDATGNTLSASYFKRNKKDELIEEVISGDVYQRILKNPPLFSAPSITFKREVLLELGGYDESLAYEDYDIWIRSSRNYKYAFYDKVNTLKRDLPRSLGKQFYLTRGNQLLKSTLKICRKAQKLNQTEEENSALSQSIRYHAQLSVLTSNRLAAKAFYKLLSQLTSFDKKDRLLLLILKSKIDVSNLYLSVLNWKMRRKSNE
ncbi:glycosyltransferase family 2 protein [Flammeovirga pacifica]|uniref:Glycosyltransferase 2-like domain-containing protein n=1 Tax=Flammeovirga pacifica TaxID=915059 RepID=A0A1S1Z3T9_FLAPC|nr:glycosyltransferase family A protein [Flammeovirga pacifica]OHX67901.1 hypothetical protein NH26_16925 [Flammeovirga pacifica]